MFIGRRLTEITSIASVSLGTNSIDHGDPGTGGENPADGSYAPGGIAVTVYYLASAVIRSAARNSR
jgi:hypothetical protein